MRQCCIFPDVDPLLLFKSNPVAASKLHIASCKTGGCLPLHGIYHHSTPTLARRFAQQWHTAWCSTAVNSLPHCCPPFFLGLFPNKGRDLRHLHAGHTLLTSCPTLSGHASLCLDCLTLSPLRLHLLCQSAVKVAASLFALNQQNTVNVFC